MKKLTVFILSLLCLPLPAQKLFLYPSTAIAPRGSYQTVTSIMTGVNDKTVTWSVSGGKLVGKNPCVANEPCTIAVYSTESGTVRLTATSNTNHAITESSSITFTPSPTPRTDHPRLLMTPDTLKALRAKATSRNPLYQSIKTLATDDLERDNAIWSWTCKGGSGQPRTDQSNAWKEQDAYLFAIMSEIAPSQAERDQWGCYGHDVFLTMAQYVLKGSLDLSKGNHWSDSALPITLTPDWLIGGGYLSSKANLDTTHAYLAKIAQEQIANVYDGAQALIGSYNEPAQLEQSNELSITGMRAMGNNYTQSRILYLVAASLTFNDTPADDPPLPNTCSATRYQICKDGTAGSLHAYWKFVAGGMLYKDWGNMEDPNVVQQAYNAAFKNLPAQPLCSTLWHKMIPCFGGGRGGESTEGTTYGGALARLVLAMNAVHTAGYDDPLLYGPQISLGTSSYFDLRYVADFTLLTGLSGVPSERSRWNFLTDGDTLNYFIYPATYGAESSLLSKDALFGRTDRSAALQWLVTNTAFGMASGSVGRCGSYCGFNAEIGNDYAASVALDMFLALPSGDIKSQPDPRPSLPTDWYDAGNQHIVVRNNWATDTNTIFSYYCTNTQVDHEHEYCGRFEIYSNGEWITKGRTEFNNYINEYSAARNQNVPELINFPGEAGPCGALTDVWGAMCALGGQFWHGFQAGLDTLQHSELPGYVAAIANSTNSYNGGWGAFAKFNGITHASRSLVYLRGSNQVVYYDRAASGTRPWHKANYIVATDAPTFNGNTASWFTRSKRQKVYWTTLAPSDKAPVLDATYAGSPNAADDWEIFGRIKLDAGNVPSASFLSILEWGNSSLQKTSTTLVRSISGQRFEGAQVGSSVVMFMHDWPATLTTMTYPASGATTHYVSDLSPNTAYSISAAGAPQIAQSDNAGVLTFKAAGTGDVTITRSGSR